MTTVYISTALAHLFHLYPFSCAALPPAPANLCHFLPPAAAAKAHPVKAGAGFSMASMKPCEQLPQLGRRKIAKGSGSGVDPRATKRTEMEWEIDEWS